MAHSLSAYGAKMYAELQLALAETYGVELASKQFSVEPSVAQELNDAITAKSDFLSRINVCLLYTSPSPRDLSTSRMPSSA